MPGDTLREAAVEAMARAEHASDCDEAAADYARCGQVPPAKWADPWEPPGTRQRDKYERRSGRQLAALLTLLDERGFVVVPKVATEDMLAVPHSPLLVLGNASNSRVEQWRAGIYKAMLAASPNPFAEEPPHG